VDKELYEDDLEELRHVSFQKIEGEKCIKEGHITDAPNDKLKMASIGDYWDEQTTKDIFDLLREYEYFFPSLVADLKGIKGDLWEMKIVLNPDAKLVKHWTYTLNTSVKEKVKKEIDKMLEAGVIFLVDKAEWLSPILIQNKKDAIEI